VYDSLPALLGEGHCVERLMRGLDRLTDSSPARTLAARLRRALRGPGFPVALGVGALLVFCWPFVRVPPPPLSHAWIHVFAAWTLAIVALALLARALASPDDGDRDG
jgi:hypothetical protein